MRGVKAVGVDEKHIGRDRVVTVVHEGSGPLRGRVLHVSEGCKGANVGEFAQALREHGGDPDAIEHCTMDMAKSYIAGVRDHLPNAEACFDPFHIVKLANEALEIVRRAEVATEPALKRTRYHWLKDPSNWTRKEVNLHGLRHWSLKTARAWRLKERLRDILAWRHHRHVPVVMLMDQWISGSAGPAAAGYLLSSGWPRRSRRTSTASATRSRTPTPTGWPSQPMPTSWLPLLAPEVFGPSAI